MNLERFHSPFFTDELACGILRGQRQQQAHSMLAGGMVLPAGAFITTIPRSVAAGRSTLSSPTPARPMILSFSERRSGPADLGRAADQKGIVTLDNLFQLSGFIPF
jgi:hypothetical protein